MASVEIFGDEESSDESEAGKKDVEMKDASEEARKKPDDVKEKKDEFAEADSDDDDVKEKKDEAKKEEKDPFAEEDSDDDDTKKVDKKADDSDDEAVGKSPKKDDAKKADDDDDLEDSDEDDVEFDDSGAVTGTGHSKGFQKKVSKKKSALDTLREAEEAEEAAARADAEGEIQAPRKPLPPKVDPRTMVVLEPDRPPSSATLHVTKLPNLVGIQPEAFDPDTFSARAEEEEFGGNAREMVRWRYKKDKQGNIERDELGHLMRESNARLIQWEDGSFTLHVGKEALMVDTVDSSQAIAPMDVVTGRTATFAGLNGYLYLSQTANYREEKKDDDEEEEGVDANGFKVTPAGTVLECMGAVGTRMTARPSSLRSEAHKSLTVAVRKKTIKRAQISEIVTNYDPEKQKEDKIKNDDALAKIKARKKNYGDGYKARARPRPGMNRRYLEDDGDFDSTNLSAIRKRTMGDDDEDDYDDVMGEYGDDDDDDDETFGNRKRPSKRAKNQLDDSDDDDDDAPAAGGKKDDDDDDDDEDDEVVTPVKSSKKRSQAVFDDDDSDD